MQYRIQRTFTTDTYRLRHGDTVEVTHKPWGNPTNKEIIDMSGTTIEPTPTYTHVPYHTREWLNDTTRTVARWILHTPGELERWRDKAAVYSKEELEFHLAWWMLHDKAAPNDGFSPIEINWIHYAQIADWLIEEAEGAVAEPAPTFAQVPYDTREWANQATRTVAHWIMVNELSRWMYEATQVANAYELETHLWMSAERFEEALQANLDDVEWLEIATWLIEDVPTLPVPLDVADEDELSHRLAELMQLATRQNLNFEKALRLARWQHIDRKAGG